MFGSDASLWPPTLSIGIEAIESADFLTEAHKRDILYYNAARFLRLDEKGQPQKRPHQGGARRELEQVAEKRQIVMLTPRTRGKHLRISVKRNDKDPFRRLTDRPTDSG